MPKYEVQTYTLCDGWINTWSIIEKGNKITPQTFRTKKKAQKELEDFFADIKQEIDNGERGPHEGYSREEFRIVPVKYPESRVDI